MMFKRNMIFKQDICGNKFNESWLRSFSDRSSDLHSDMSGLCGACYFYGGTLNFFTNSNVLVFNDEPPSLDELQPIQIMEI